jgi:hypothetical protein
MVPNITFQGVYCFVVVASAAAVTVAVVVQALFYLFA